jgi:hypothetical protein
MGAAESAFEQDTWVIGVILALIADILSNTGTNLQKLAHTQIEQLEEKMIKDSDMSKQPTPEHDEDDNSTKQDVDDKSPLLKHKHSSRIPAAPLKIPTPDAVPEDQIVHLPDQTQDDKNVDEDKEPQSNYCASPTWIIALVYASQSIVSPLGSLTLVVNLFLARWMHGEKITVLGVTATLLIVAGSFLTVLFADHSSLNLDIEGILRLYFTTRFIVYASIMVFCLSALWIFAKRWGRPSARVEENEKVYPLFKLAIACLNGTLGGHNVLFAKMTVNLVSVGGVSVYKYFMFYFTLAMLVFTIVTQVSWLNEGLKRFDAIFMIPVSTSFWVTFSVFSGIITTGEYMLMSWEDIGFFSFGMLLIVLGVLIFTRHKSVVQVDVPHKQSMALRSSRMLVVPHSAISANSASRRRLSSLTPSETRQ